MLVLNAIKRLHFNNLITSISCTTMMRSRIHVLTVDAHLKSYQHFTIINVFTLEKSHSRAKHVVGKFSLKSNIKIFFFTGEYVNTMGNL